MPDGLLLMVVEGLAVGNLLVGALNLVPGLPLDGGRVLKAAVWQLTGSLHRGTVVAAWGGRVTAVAVLLWPLAQEALFDSRPGPVRLRARLRHRLLPLDRRHRRAPGRPDPAPAAAPRGAQPRPPYASPSPRTCRWPRPYAARGRPRPARIVTVTGSGRPVGVVNEAALLATPEDRRPWLAVSTVARGVDDGLSLPVSITGEELVRAITRTPATEYLLVEDDGSVYGVLTTADVDRAFRAVPD